MSTLDRGDRNTFQVLELIEEGKVTWELFDLGRSNRCRSEQRCCSIAYRMGRHDPPRGKRPVFDGISDDYFALGLETPSNGRESDGGRLVLTREGRLELDRLRPTYDHEHHGSDAYWRGRTGAVRHQTAEGSQ